MLKMHLAVGMQFEDSDESIGLQWHKSCFIHIIPAYSDILYDGLTQV